MKLLNVNNVSESSYAIGLFFPLLKRDCNHVVTLPVTYRFYERIANYFSGKYAQILIELLKEVAPIIWSVKRQTVTSGAVR